jgi:glutamyl/glutaminyl-tRNA synthetase
MEPSQTIIQQYLAYNLDKNRVTTLLEFGQDSDMVLKYLPAGFEVLKFPKSTVQESHNNLAKISYFITENWIDQSELIKTCTQDIKNYTNNTQAKFVEQTLLWQDKLKAWIKLENLNMGSTLHPLRVALSGSQQSPSPFEMLSILSKQQVKERIELSLYILGQNLEK